METYLTDLIQRMLDKSDQDTVRISSDTISWKALREAEKIANDRYIPQLIDFIDNEKDKEKRGRAYFLLGHITRNTQNATATGYLISRIDKEKDKYVLSTLLDRIQYLDKPLNTDITPIIHATRSNQWQIRDSAISALKGSKDPLAEDTLIDIIKDPGSKNGLWYVNSTLANIGTRKSIPYLLALLDHKQQDVSGTALNAILAISDASDLPVFITQLEKGKNKFTALLGVIRYGNATVIPNVVKRIKELVSKKRPVYTVGANGNTEIVYAMEFLSGFAATTAEPKQMFDLLTTKKQDLLWDSEKDWLAQNRDKFDK
ncbi:hypothetical protein F0L74_22790 [Chitinophaga agrisoli]|uniref:HEAT repeat protein n=1 Tax=Chitinophaga agrisoli TaxID=2607653 RepID=A0A5B2VIZ8_9BACT|nr:hypothetical protein [Chitinophaga agrisoli]KAA2239041.1 hypothetical protein F0L74_22790 [Chitinophaga agrisoli]